MPRRANRATVKRARERTGTSRPSASATDDLRLLWATPIFIRRLASPPEWNALLEQRIRERQAREPGQQRSNYRGWQSRDDFLDVSGGRGVPEIEALRTLLRDALLDCLGSLVARDAVTSIRIHLSGVANVLTYGGYHTHHTHPGALLSGSYYVNAGLPDEKNPHSGKLCFYEPRAGGALHHSRLLGFSEDFDMSPETGMIVIFPGFLGHSVHPYTGPGERITVAFNAYIEES